MILRCEACATLLAPEETACTSCGRDELERVRAAGTGTVVSWTVVDCSSVDLPLALVPCTLAIVELDEGPWIYTWIEGSCRCIRIGRCGWSSGWRNRGSGSPCSPFGRLSQNEPRSAERWPGIESQ
ncbi:Zn-ribbon domain-containing OB-fold protein [Rhodococcus sp. MTM3W5.2]|uniref:Zn-ribbon domain-containing OB-fold protein n=1 Tax=Rhodococcus sp. MTM3W5.2 TaxID=1805827 RepID=UPI001CB91DD4|nr:OB-fold domain-containing protein [Rhodococcus sp. MTM3W5.2]